MSIAFLDLRSGYWELKTEIDLAVASLLDSGMYIMGSEVNNFEIEFAAYCDVEYAVGVANGLDALVLALRALDVGIGDEVIVPSNTFIATWLAVSAVGAIPVPVEPNPSNHTIEISQILPAITKRTKAIIPVHLYGHPADIDPILSVASARGLVVIEDAAQAHGARYRGRRIGGHSDAVCWSFYPAKNLGALGDGGCITTSRLDIAEKLQILRNYGSAEKYKNVTLGVNSRLDALQAAILRVKLRYLDEWNLRRVEIAKLYQSELSESGLTLPLTSDWAEPVWHLFVALTPNRDALQKNLMKAGIETQIHYPIPPHMQEAYAGLNIAPEAFPVAQKLSQELLSLPIGPHLAFDGVSRVIREISIFKNK
jgi:dTDP-4-amino-4,6-dideoxygalactose transaminase